MSNNFFRGGYQLFTPREARFFGGYKFSLKQLPRLRQMYNVATALKFICKILPPSAQNYFNKRVDAQEHFTRVSGGLSDSCQGPIIWNKIPNEFSALPSLYQFKRA